MKTFSFTDDTGAVFPNAVCDFSQLVINVPDKYLFVKFDIWISAEAKAAGKAPISSLEFRPDSSGADAIAAANSGLFSGIQQAAFAVSAAVFPPDAKDV
jgi:hypothetical protein